MTMLVNPFAAAPAGGPAVTWDTTYNSTAAIAYSNGNLTATNTLVAGSANVRATTGRSTGKYYFEILASVVAPAVNSPYFGLILVAASNSTKIGTVAGMGWSQQTSDPYNWDNGTHIGPFGSAFVANDVCGIAVDFGAGKIWYARNNVWLNSGNPSAGTGAMWSTITGTLYPAVSCNGTAGQATAITGRFSSASFGYTPPTGFSSWQ